MNRLVRFSTELFPWLVALFCTASYLIDPDFFVNTVVAKDSVGGSGIVESMTVIILLIGITIGFVILIRFWKIIPTRLLRLGLILWILASIYFAGEEISWGQWIFQWETPETLAEINKQKETNLHNTSSWLNEKPRTAVELWILFSGLVVALLRVKGAFRFANNDLREWINPLSVGVSVCIVFLLSKTLELFQSEFAQKVSDSEIREMLVAYFLSLYLFSVFVKLRLIRNSEKSEDSEEAQPS
jgi:hypothetical protein